MLMIAAETIGKIQDHRVVLNIIDWLFSPVFIHLLH